MDRKTKRTAKEKPTDFFRIGIGYDVHRFEKGRKLILGGVMIPYEMGLMGHSDADVLIHSICDALLGSVGAGDIGKHFPDTDKKYKGISSLIILAKVGDLLRKKGYKLINIDSTLILEYPKISKYTNLMCRRIAAALKISKQCISVKATTNEKLGAFGRGEGCASYAIASVTKASGI